MKIEKLIVCLSEISAMCSRVVVLSNGRLAADDTPQGLQKRLSREGLYRMTLCGDRAALENALLAAGGFEEITFMPETGGFGVTAFSRRGDAAAAAAKTAEDAIFGRK